MNNDILIELDDDGYPTDETLDQIREYKGDYNQLMADIAFLFGHYGRCEFDGNHWIVATGGWSGCESVISALQDNSLFWAMCWYMSKSGGYYEFKIKSDG